MALATFRRIAPDRADEWVAKGHRLRDFFAHRLFQLPKCGPDGYRIALPMCGVEDTELHWQLLLYADPALVDRFPLDLFFDDDLIWHQQHFGRPGQVASATLTVGRDVMHAMVFHSDLVQRIGRRRQHKTQIEKRLGGWPWMLLNGVLAVALERGIGTVRTPSSALALRHTDRARAVQPFLFERVYDRPPAELGAVRRGDWWEIDVAGAAASVLEPVTASEPLADEKTVCVMHDLERGFGHRDYDPELAARADEAAQRTLEAMLTVEEDAGVRATYNVVGKILCEVRPEIERRGHALAFHSFDHSDSTDQLVRCREVDYRLKGYRLPRSRLTAETTDERLALHNFEWLARSEPAHDVPRLDNRLVRIPVALDDFPLYWAKIDYDEWEAGVLDRVERTHFTAMGLHDCYAHLWLPRYAELLDKLSARARLRTLDDVSADVVMSAAE